VAWLKRRLETPIGGEMAILVTGGAGYVGSHTVRLLSEQGHEVVVLDTLVTGHRSAVCGARLVVGDIRDDALVGQLVKEHDLTAVVHFAGVKVPHDSMRDPGRYFEDNVGATAKFLATLDRLGVRHLVFSSTCAVYGNPPSVPVCETHPLRPESPYGESKRMVEQMLAWFDRCRDFRSVSLRYFNAAGASLDGHIGEDWRATSNLIPVAIRAVCGRGSPLQIFGSDYPTPDGTAIRDYVHVVDLARAHVQALSYLQTGSASIVLNLGTGRGSSVVEVVEELERVCGQPVPMSRSPRRPGDPAALWADNRQARQVLHWKPQFGLTEIVESAWAWHSTHLDGFTD
jgi:UDP-glucose-4-epimerase GalE